MIQVKNTKKKINEKIIIDKPGYKLWYVYTNDWFDKYIENDEGKHFRDAYGKPDWIPWKK